MFVEMKFYAVCPYIFQTALRPIVRLFLRFFCNLKVSGLENIRHTDGGFILTSNHIHELDGFLLPAVLPLSDYSAPIFPVSREGSFYEDKGIRGKIYGGYFFKFMGAYPAHSGLNNYQKSLRNQVEILNDDHSILIFPEGKVSDNDIKGGVGFLAAETQKPVIPVQIKGIKNMNITDFLLFRASMTVSFQPPLLFKLNQKKASVSPKTAKNVATQIGEKI